MSFYSKLYNGAILPVMLGGFHVLSPFVSKIGEGLRERKGLLDRVSRFRRTIGEKKVILFHCASAGEFESLRPLSKEFDRERFALAVSYFSPSARAVARNSTEFDFVDCSPIDSLEDVDAYLEELNPTCICITKHDIWPNFVWQAKLHSIPCLLISGNFHPKSLKMLPGALGFHRAVYNDLTEIMTVSEQDSRRAIQLCGKDTHIVTTGDSRFDQVLRRAGADSALPPEIAAFCRTKTVLIVGSSHADDEGLMFPVIKKLRENNAKFCALAIPHDPSARAAGRIRSLAAEFGLTITDPDSDARINQSANMMLVNRTGILADLYQLGSVAYVGGGFGKGVHSVLEPMSHGLPVLTGPNISVSNEANQAQADKLLVVVKGRRQAGTVLEEWLSDSTEHTRRQAAAREFVVKRSGATKRIAARIQEYLNGCSSNS